MHSDSRTWASSRVTGHGRRTHTHGSASGAYTRKIHIGGGIEQKLIERHCFIRFAHRTSKSFLNILVGPKPSAQVADSFTPERPGLHCWARWIQLMTTYWHFCVVCMFKSKFSVFSWELKGRLGIVQGVMRTGRKDGNAKHLSGFFWSADYD